MASRPGGRSRSDSAVARILALAPDLFFAAKIKETLTAAGHEVSLAAGSEDFSSQDQPPDVVIVDLDSSSGYDTGHFGDPTRLLGFYSHVDVETRRHAEEAGFDLVVPRSKMAREMPDLIARLIGSRH
jgi:hypothetical protein